MEHKPKYNPAIHHRRSIRLKEYDYAQAGLYFVTICVQHRQCLFGNVVNGEMVLNEAGRMIEKWYAELRNKFPDIYGDAHIIMPNHFHCIIENTGTVVGADRSVGADLRVCPPPSEKNPQMGERNDEILGERNGNVLGEHAGDIWGEHIGSPLQRVVQWFKTMTTNEYIRNVKNNGWPRFDGKLWQRNYYEHIIRNEKSYDTIVHYIHNNPVQWQLDKLNPINQEKNTL